LPPDYLPTPAEISHHLKPQLAQLSVQPNLDNYGKVLNQLEVLSIDYVLNAFEQMKWEWHLKQHFSTATIAAQLGVVSRHQRLLGRLLEMLAEEGILQWLNDLWEVVVLPKKQETATPINALLKQYPAAQAELTLLDRCGSKLAEVLQGECDPLQLIFPEGDLTTATQLYQDAPIARIANTLIQQAILTMLAQLPAGRKVHVLEIGAGTGGTTAHLLPHLSHQQTDYVFTDISPLFLTQAQTKFQDYPFVRYQLLDIELVPEEQGFSLHHYDLIVAVNVLHATPNLRQTLQHVHSLLAPGGMLVLLEGTAPLRWLDLIFGLTEGWWKFADDDLRPAYPLLSAAQWQILLQENGFKQTEAIAPAHKSVSQQTMIVAQANETETATLPPRHWLIFSDNQGVGQQLGTHLQSRGDDCTFVFACNQYEPLTKQSVKIDPTKPTDFQRLLNSVPDSALHGVVHLWSLDAVNAQAMIGTDLEAASQKCCGSTLHIVQSLVKAKISERPSLWLVTKGAVPAGKASKVPGLAQSPLWGMGKVIALEHPELNCVRVDLDPQASTKSEVEALFAEICSATSEDQIAYHDNFRLVARLRHYQMPAAPIRDHKQIFSKDNTYLITGGLGGLGLLVTRWMVERGARHLVLVGRRGATSAIKERLKALEQMGTQVIVAQADVSKFEQISQVLADIESTLPPLRGIIHSTGVLDDGILLQQNWARFERVLAPKVAGAWHLHTLTQHLPLDFFVLFSSAASLLGSAGQANHGAANAFLDALAYYRQAQGLPGLSINWGAWSEIGAAAQRKADEQFKPKGITPITPKQGLQVLEQLFSIQPSKIQNAIAQVGVIPIDWSTFVQQLLAVPPLLAELVRGEKEPQLEKDKSQQETQPIIVNQLQTASQEERRTLLIDYLQAQVTKSLGLSQLDVQQPLNNTGLDSLMALELRNYIRTQLGVELMIGTFLKGASVSELATEIELQLAATIPTQTAQNQINQSVDNDWIEGEI
jgi:microcystin synthetase protein McyG